MASFLKCWSALSEGVTSQGWSSSHVNQQQLPRATAQCTMNITCKKNPKFQFSPSTTQKCESTSTFTSLQGQTRKIGKMRLSIACICTSKQPTNLKHNISQPIQLTLFHFTSRYYMGLQCQLTKLYIFYTQSQARVLIKCEGALEALMQLAKCKLYLVLWFSITSLSKTSKVNM